ncbi:MAG: class I SAM-dependent methyltransferase [Deltaproteobacteria bacterium]|nr:class I SAM-dependent methyltransferase [Deltaproteobacteria bacterium]
MEKMCRNNDQLENEESRIRTIYARRDASGKTALYGWDRLDSTYMAYRNEVAWVLAFKEVGFQDLSRLEILDVGCGSGRWLRMLVEWGADPQRLHGVDLLEDRISRARVLSPAAMTFRVGNAGHLDYPDNTMDLAAASTVFSSILDPTIRLALAREMNRVVRPGGWIMLFDYAVSDPRNPDTTGIRKKEIARLFPGLKLLHTFKLIFPPPLLRLLPARLLCLAHLVEALFPWVCTHRLYMLSK